MDRLVWAGRHTVRVGDYHLGLRTSTPELLERLGQLLGAHLIQDAAAPANYSLQVNGAGKFDFSVPQQPGRGP